jgi:peroxiredoxin
MSLKVGDVPPPITLPSKPGNPVEVSASFGKRPVVILFFPLAYSSVCTAEMCTFRDSWDRWSGLGAEIYGISIDSPFVADRFRADERIPFPLLSDFNKTVAANYGALHEDLMGLKGVTKRAAFVVGRDGKITYAWVSENPGVQVDFEAIAKAVEASR